MCDYGKSQRLAHGGLDTVVDQNDRADETTDQARETPDSAAMLFSEAYTDMPALTRQNRLDGHSNTSVDDSFGQPVLTDSQAHAGSDLPRMGQEQHASERGDRAQNVTGGRATEVEIGQAEIEPPTQIEIGQAEIEPPVEVEIGPAEIEPPANVQVEIGSAEIEQPHRRPVAPQEVRPGDEVRRIEREAERADRDAQRALDDLGRSLERDQERLNQALKQRQRPASQ